VTADGVQQGNESLTVVVEALPVGILMIDGTGSIVLVNATAESILGYSRAELIGRPVEILLPERLRVRHVNDRSGYLMNPAQRRMGAGRDLFAVRKDGREIPVEIGLSPAQTPQGGFVLASIIDISERKAAEATRDRLIKAVSETAHNVAESAARSVAETTARAAAEEATRHALAASDESNAAARNELEHRAIAAAEQAARSFVERSADDAEAARRAVAALVDEKLREALATVPSTAERVAQEAVESARASLAQLKTESESDRSAEQESLRAAAEAAAKPVPEMVTEVPPAVGPEVGVTLPTVGAAVAA